MLEWISVIALVLSIVIGLSLLITIEKYVKSTLVLSFISIFLAEFGTIALLFSDITIFKALLALCTFFRVVNIARVVVRRMNIKELKGRFVRSEIYFSTLSALLLLAHVYIGHNGLLLTFSVLALFGAFILLINTIITVYLSRMPKGGSLSAEPKINPTVSICIPARNETEDLTDCIESLVKSTYQKLEILVLDDCSHDKTPQIIRSLAHGGVRFIEGQEPGNDWIAKNSAYQRLLNESSGEIVIFAGVDVRFGVDTVQKIVQALNDDTDMISTLPWRDESRESTVFIQPLRYWWELAVPRLRKARPPVLSTCWAIKRSALSKIGEFHSVKRSVIPEGHFAHRLKSRYRFLLSGERLGVASVKRPAEQFETALRTRYPLSKRRPEGVFLVLLQELLIFVTPNVAIVTGLINDNQTLIITGLLTILFLAITNVVISSLSVRKTWLLGLFTPFLLLFEEWYLLIRSMLAYEFGVVKWKERNICLPLLSVEKSLPKI